MANILSLGKQVAIISSLAEGSSIRATERILKIHRDTIIRLSVRIGQGCQRLLDSMTRDLTCERLQMDGIWGYVGRHLRNVTEDHREFCGDAWKFIAVDADP